jgi:hypothetical protein
MKIKETEQQANPADGIATADLGRHFMADNGDSSGHHHLQ